LVKGSDLKKGERGKAKERYGSKDRRNLGCSKKGSYNRWRKWIISAAQRYLVPKEKRNASDSNPSATQRTKDSRPRG